MLLKDLIREQTNIADLEAEKAIHDLDVIGAALVQLPPEKENVKISVINKLKQISASIINFLAKTKGQNQQPDPQENVTEAEDIDSSIMNTIATLKSQIKAVETLDVDEQEKKKFITPLRQSLEQLTNEIEELKSAKNIAVEKQKEAENFIKEVSGYLITLGNKVQGFEEPAEEDIAGMLSGEKKKIVSAKAFTSTLRQALFGKIVDIQEGGITPDEIKQFLAACVDGKVINMRTVIAQPRGNISDHVEKDHKDMFNIFVNQDIFSYSPGTTSGAIGPGEMALSMMGNPAEKAKVGDLLVDGKEIEVKAGKKGGSGGRLNSKAIAKATTGWLTWRKNIGEILSVAPDDAKLEVTTKAGKITLTVDQLNKWNGDVVGGSGKKGSRYNWTLSGLKALNNEVLAPYSNPEKTYKLFQESIKSLVLNYDKVNDAGGADKLINRAINGDGTVDIAKMFNSYARIAYESYHLSDGITTILLLRTDTLDYVIIDDGKDLVKKIVDGEIKVSSFTWNDDQQTPTPGYMPED